MYLFIVINDIIRLVIMLLFHIADNEKKNSGQKF